MPPINTGISRIREKNPFNTELQNLGAKNDEIKAINEAILNIVSLLFEKKELDQSNKHDKIGLLRKAEIKLHAKLESLSIYEKTHEEEMRMKR